MLKTLNAKILLTVTGIVCLTLTLSVILGLWQTSSIIQNIQKKNAEVLLDSINHIVENEYSSIQFHRQAILNLRKKELKDVVDIAYAVLSDYSAKSVSGNYSLEHAQNLALHTIKQMRWDDEVGYFWINDTTLPIPKMIMHPTLPELDGTVLNSPIFNGAFGRDENLFRAANLVAKTEGSGYVDYLWPKPTGGGKLTNRQPKLSFVRGFEPWEWIIGSGVYIDDIEAEAKQRLDAVLVELRKTFQNIHIGENSYMFMFTNEKQMLIHPKLQGQDATKLRNPDTGGYLLDEIIQAEKTLKKTIEYSWEKPKGDQGQLFSKKLYVSYFEPLEWYICVSYYQEEVNQPARELGWRLLILSALIIVIALVVSFLLGRSVTSPLNKLSVAAETIDHQGIEATVIPIAGSKEIRHLGEVLSRTLATISEKEQSLRNSELKYRQLVENVNDAIFIAQGGLIKFANRKTSKLTGYQLDDLDNRSFAGLVHPDDQVMVGDYHLRRMRGEEGVPDAYSFRILDKSNVELRILLSTVVIDWDGSRAVLCCARDITAQKELEIAFYQAQKMDAIGQLAGGIAHDFNNMLSGILGAAQLLKHGGKSFNNKENEYVDLIIKTVGRAVGLTTKLLAFGHKGKATSEVIDVHQIIDDTHNILARTIDKKIGFSIEQNADSSISVGDRTGIQNALINLGINASHSMPNGGVVHIKTRNVTLGKKFCDGSQFDIEPGEFIDIEVQDSGCGIPKEHMEKIFEPFFTTKRKDRGTGLGLAATYGTARDHHGAITVTSELGIGTVFHIYLPCSQGALTVKEVDGKVVAGVGTILLVDDEEIIRITGKQALENMGYDVLLAENGKIGVEVYNNNYSEIDVVLMDMIMPEMNGAEAFAEMKKINSNCKVIIASGFTDYENLTSLRQQGLAGFIHKPYSDHEISKLLTDVFSESE